MYIGLIPFIAKDNSQYHKLLTDEQVHILYNALKRIKGGSSDVPKRSFSATQTNNIAPSPENNQRTHLHTASSKMSNQNGDVKSGASKHQTGKSSAEINYQISKKELPKSYVKQPQKYHSAKSYKKLIQNEDQKNLETLSKLLSNVLTQLLQSHKSIILIAV